MAAHGSAYFAHDQTSGKGQRGKSWMAEKGTHIALSVVIAGSDLDREHPFQLTVLTGLAVYDFFSRYAGEETRIKWPNDLYWRDRKAGGILVENLFRGNIWQWAVAGMGINLNQTAFPASLPNPVSLLQITGRLFDGVAMAKELCQCLERRYRELLSGNESAMLASYNRVLYKRGERVTLVKEGAIIPCTIDGVNARGNLKVSGAEQDFFRHGEVVWTTS